MDVAAGLAESAANDPARNKHHAVTSVAEHQPEHGEIGNGDEGSRIDRTVFGRRKVAHKELEWRKNSRVLELNGNLGPLFALWNSPFDVVAIAARLVYSRLDVRFPRAWQPPGEYDGSTGPGELRFHFGVEFTDPELLPQSEKLDSVLGYRAASSLPGLIALLGRLRNPIVNSRPNTLRIAVNIGDGGVTPTVSIEDRLDL